MLSWGHFLVFLLLVCASCTSTFLFREVLNQKLLSRNKEPNYLPSYAAQRMISLFCKSYSDTPAAVLFRTTVLKSITAAPGSVVKQGTDFEKTIALKSQGMLTGVMNEENDGPDPPIELLYLFEGAGRKTIRKYLTSSLAIELDLKSTSSTMKMEEWLRLTILEAAVAWKQFRCFFTLVRCYGRVLDLNTDVSVMNERMLNFDGKISDLDKKLFDLEDKDFYLSNSASKDNIETRLKIYLNRYEVFLKPKVFKFSFGCSFVTVMAVFYFFQYLHQISRVYAVDLSNAIVDRLRREHEAFISGATKFATNITTTERTFKIILPFEGSFHFQSLLVDGTLVPSELYSPSISSQYAKHRTKVKLSLYHVHFTPWDKFKFLGIPHMHQVDDKSVELIFYTSRKCWDEAWFKRFVRQLNNRFTTQETWIDMINSY